MPFVSMEEPKIVTVTQDYDSDSDQHHQWAEEDGRMVIESSTTLLNFRCEYRLNVYF